jgi:uncharacterized membrane protein HdeD (DUF308 family)
VEALEISGLLGGIISIVFGIVVIVWPRVLAYVIGIWLILIGVIAVINSLR